ncbi:putative transcription regulator MED7 family [Rosa chinensis]|uniref:Mediator of RNA polymerase II transcription subunit 7 n=1 Tax=Rosa chinensis TaxID=74649 RepID=A0A2P6RD35_ROSCH|nr:putative transcription regulator MED7 family [Rosa chinensis]
MNDMLPSLEEQGVCQLYPKGPNIGTPSQYARRVEEISLMFKNLHHLLNSLRPHQARATLVHILELHIKRRKQAVEDVKRTLLIDLKVSFELVPTGGEKKHRHF